MLRYNVLYRVDLTIIMGIDVITSNIKVELLFWNYPVNLSKWRPPDYINFNVKYVFPYNITIISRKFFYLSNIFF